MSIEIKVGPPVITISQGRTFMVTDRHGYINTDSDQGVYAIDTRFLSFSRMFINRVPWEVINASSLTFYAARFHLTNPRIMTEGGEIPARSLGLTVNRMVSEGLHEEFEIINYSGKRVLFVLELGMRSDFADIFEVKTKNIVQRGKQETQWNAEKKRLSTSYDHRDFHRAAVYEITHVNSPLGYANGRIFFEIELEQGEKWQACGDLILEHGQHVIKPSANSCSLGQTSTHAAGATPSPQSQPTSDFDKRQARWQDRCTAITSPRKATWMPIAPMAFDLRSCFRRAGTARTSIRITTRTTSHTPIS